MHQKPFRLICSLLLIHLSFTARPQVITDTIFYNTSWQICEQPMAAYYRLGTLTVDSLWYYTGPFKDYSMNGTLLAEGRYSETGEKNGPLNVYDTEGKILAIGNYVNNKPAGDWEWKYTSGATRAIVHFPGDSDNFDIVFYRDNTGRILLENGNGDFEWNTSAFEDVPRFLKFTGHYKNGKRTGTWKYYNSGDTYYKYVLCQETYNDDGTLKRSKTFGYNAQITHKLCAEYDFLPVTLKITERVLYDNFFKRGPDSVAEVNLLNYLTNRTSVNIVLKNKKFEDAMLYVLKDLERYRNKLNYWSKDIEGKIEFRLGDKSMPEDITVNGNISPGEKEFLLYLMAKFKNFEMPMQETIGYEQFHTIYFFSIDMKPYVPAALKQYTGKELFFTMLPKDKYIVWLDANKKKIKNAIRSEYLHY